MPAENIIILYFTFNMYNFNQFKKIGYIALLFTLLLQTGGLLLIYKIQQYNVQRLMGMALNNNETIFKKLTLSLTDLQRYKVNSHELSIGDEMYDVKSINIIGDKVEMLALEDKDEESIVENIKKSTGTGNQPDQQLPGKLFELFTMLYMSLTREDNLLLRGRQKSIFSLISTNIISHIPDISTPPPRLS